MALITSVLLPRGVTGATSSAFDSSGGDLLIVGYAGYNLPDTMSDNKGNTLTALTAQSTGAAQEGRSRIYYAENPTVGTGHTVTWAYAGYGNGTAVAAVFSGYATASVFDVEDGFATNSNVSSIQPTTLTPSQNNSLIVSMTAFTNNMTSGTGTIDLDFIIAQQREFGGSNVVGGLFAYLEQGTAGGVNPTITAPTSSGPMSTVIASFKSAGGAPASIVPLLHHSQRLRNLR